MENARQLTPEEQKLQSVRIRREMFQGNNLSPLLFMSALIPMLLVSRKVKKDINWEIYGLYNQNKKQTDRILISNTVQIFSKDIEIEFTINKYATLIMKRGINYITK